MECGVCFSPYSSAHKPLFLRCGHTFCSVCIDDLTLRDRANCPNCARSFKGEEHIINFALIQAEELKENPHEDLLGCPLHPHKKAKFYCKVCKAVFCNNCFSKHKTHEPEGLTEYVLQDARTKLPEIQEEVKSIADYAAQVEALKMKAEYNLKKVTQAVQNYFDEARAKLELQLANSLEEIEAVRTQNLACLTAVNDSVETKLRSLQRKEALLNDASQSGQVAKWIEATKVQDSLRVQEFDQTLLTFSEKGGALESATLSLAL
jgi:hypothetical protein